KPPFPQFGKSASKVVGERMGGVVVEATVLPPGVDLERHVLAHRAAPGQPLDVPVPDCQPVECGRERVLVEVRIPGRTRKPSNIDDRLHKGTSVQFYDVGECPSVVPDGG